MIDTNHETRREFTITVLGRTLEHLGVQMYKRRDVAIAELVANCWDAGAENVFIQAPGSDTYDQHTSTIIITDDGLGMSETQVQHAYLVVGRNRRREGQVLTKGRPVMGRKGIGKLAGFGLAMQMTIETWQEGRRTRFTLDMNHLKQEDGQAEALPIIGTIGSPPPDTTSASGTRITLTNLKHSTSLNLGKLREALGRRFGRKVFGEMGIYVNGIQIETPYIEIEKRYPESGYATEQLEDGTTVAYYYAFAKSVIRSPEMRGFTIYVRGKTAQAPPFFFGVEGTASGQHATRYLTGVIEADFLDDGTDDASDLISTDRQEIDWENKRVTIFNTWGGNLTRRAFREWVKSRGDAVEEELLQDESLSNRIEQLDTPSQRQVSKFIQSLSQADPDPEHVKGLADSVLRAYEYRHFHDVIDQLEAVSDNPEQLQLTLFHLKEWKVLESRAILEIVNGRLNVIEKFHAMIVNNAPETASKLESDNMHDLLAGFPWLLNPEWQVLAEEKQVSTQLREWGSKDITDEDERMRFDFLALGDERKLVIIEIKRSGHPVSIDELHRLERYKERLSKAHSKDLYMVLICGGNIDLSPSAREAWNQRNDGEIREWKEIYERTHTYYEHYRAILEGDVHSQEFSRKQSEVAKTRIVLTRGGAYRGRKDRAKGIGPQDTNYSEQHGLDLQGDE